MRGSSIRARPRESAKQPLHEVANHANPLESLLALHNNGLKGSRIPVSGSRLGGTGTRQRPSSARPSSSKGFPEGMMGVIGQSKAVAEMQSAVRNVGRIRPASASVHGRHHQRQQQQQQQQQASSSGVFGGSSIYTNGDALSVGGRHLHTGAEVAMGSSAEDYIPVKKLGEGASGVVYLVKLRSSRDGEADSMYVMKQVEIGKGRGISAPSSERFSAIARHERDGALREVRLMAMIDSPHLIRYITSFYGPSSSGATQSMYIVMQHADGGSLAELLRRCKQYSKDIPEAQVWKCMIQICSGLAAMHEHRVVHRDIKPGNILLCGGDYKIADLGIAADTTSVQGRMRTHKCGTPCYMAPEVSNDMPYDGRADVWSLGCLLYEMCTLCLAFPEGTVRDASTRAESGQSTTRVEAILKSLQLPEAMSDELNDHVMWCLASDPADRPTPAELLGTRMCSVRALEMPSPATRASTNKDGEERRVLNGGDAQCVQGGVKKRQRPVSAPIRRGGGAGGGGGGGQPPKARAVKDSVVDVESRAEDGGGGGEGGVGDDREGLDGGAAREEEHDEAAAAVGDGEQEEEEVVVEVSKPHAIVGGVTVSMKPRLPSPDEQQLVIQPTDLSKVGEEEEMEEEEDMEEMPGVDSRTGACGRVDDTMQDVSGIVAHDTSYDFVAIAGGLPLNNEEGEVGIDLGIDGGAAGSQGDDQLFSPRLGSVQDPLSSDGLHCGFEGGGGEGVGGGAYSALHMRPMQVGGSSEQQGRTPLGSGGEWHPSQVALSGRRSVAARARPSSASMAGQRRDVSAAQRSLESCMSSSGASIQPRPLRPASATTRTPLNGGGASRVRPASATLAGRRPQNMGDSGVLGLGFGGGDGGMEAGMVITPMHMLSAGIGPRHTGSGLRPRVSAQGVGGSVFARPASGNTRQFGVSSALKGKDAPPPDSDRGDDDEEAIDIVEEDVVDEDEDDDEWEGMRVDTETVAQALGDSSGAHGLIAASSLHIHHHHHHQQQQQQQRGHHYAGTSGNKPNRPASASIQRPPAGSSADLVSSRARVRPASASVKGSRSGSMATGSGAAARPVGYVARPGSGARQGAPVHVVNIGVGGGAGNFGESDVGVDEDEEDGFSDAADDYYKSDYDARMHAPEGAIPQGHSRGSSNNRPATANEAHRRGAGWSSQSLGGGKGGGGHQSRQRPASATSHSPSSRIGPFRSSPYSPNGGQGYIGGQAASPSSRRRETAKARSDRLASAGAERRLRTHLHKALSHTADHGKSGVPITSLAGLIQAQLGVPPAAQTLTGPHGEKQSIRAYLESNPTLYHIDEYDDTVALSAAGLGSGETASSASRRILSRMGVSGGAGGLRRF